MKEIIRYSSDIIDTSNKLDYYAMQLTFLYSDIQSVLASIYIYKTISCEQHFVASMVYNSYYTEIETALAYRIIGGITKVLDNHGDSHSYNNLLNSISQNDCFRDNLQLRREIDSIQSEIKKIITNSNIKVLRDKCINRSERATCTGFLSHPVVFREPPISEIESHSCIIEEAH